MSSFEEEVLLMELRKIEKKIIKIEDNDEEIEIIVNLKENEDGRPKIC